MASFVYHLVWYDTTTTKNDVQILFNHFWSTGEEWKVTSFFFYNTQMSGTLKTDFTA